MPNFNNTFIFSTSGSLIIDAETNKPFLDNFGNFMIYARTGSPMEAFFFKIVDVSESKRNIYFFESPEAAERVTNCIFDNTVKLMWNETKQNYLQSMKIPEREKTCEVITDEDIEEVA